MLVRILLLCVTSVATTAFTTTTTTRNVRRGGGDDDDSALHADLTSDRFAVGVLGDLHIDPRTMEDYETGREQWIEVLNGESEARAGNVALVSLGDLGESKSVRPDETNELFAGTTECHELAAEFLGSFGVPYEVIGGNHGEWPAGVGDGRYDMCACVELASALDLLHSPVIFFLSLPLSFLSFNSL